MNRKSRHLSIRLSQSEYKILAAKLIEEQKTISEVTRDLIKCYTGGTINRIEGDFDDKK